MAAGAKFKPGQVVAMNADGNAGVVEIVAVCFFDHGHRYVVRDVLDDYGKAPGSDRRQAWVVEHGPRSLTSEAGCTRLDSIRWTGCSMPSDSEVAALTASGRKEYERFVKALEAVTAAEEELDGAADVLSGGWIGGGRWRE